MMYENPVKFFYVPFMFSDTTTTEAMLSDALSGESEIVAACKSSPHNG